MVSTSASSLIQNSLLLCDDSSIDAEDVRTEKKIELITLHRAMKKLDMDLDYSAVVDPLLADQGPALAHIPRLIKTIQRLGKIKDEYLLEREQQRAAPLAAPAKSAVAAQIRLTHSVGSDSCPHNPASCPNPAAIRIDVRHEQENLLATHSDEQTGRVGVRRLRADKISGYVPPEVLPSWGPLKRYTEAIDTRRQVTYNEVVTAATWVFQRMLVQEGGPKKCTLAA
jgi:hypothetical protein